MRGVLVGALVLGVLVVGGVGTGRTLALWHDASTGAPGSVRSADTMDLRVEGTTTASVVGPTLQVPGLPQTSSEALRLDAPVAARNLRAAVWLDAVSSSSSVLTSTVQVSARTVASAVECTPATDGFQKVGATWVPVRVTTTPLSSQGTTTLCLSFRLSPDLVTVLAQTGTLTMTLRAQQVRT